MSGDILRFPDAQSMAREGASLIASWLNEAIRTHGNASLLLPGGRSPGAMLGLLATPALSADVAWHAVHVFQCDERFVPPTHPWSNRRFLEESFLSLVPIPDSNIVFIDTGCPSVDASAQAYELMLRRHSLSRAKRPLFDVALLGIGLDGHTASLFPGSRSGTERSWVTGVDAMGEPSVKRISLTVAALSDSAKVMFLVPTPDKLSIAESIATGRFGDSPAAGVAARERTVWMLNDPRSPEPGSAGIATEVRCRS